MKKLAFLLVTLTILSILLTACGPQATPTPVAPVVATEVVPASTDAPPPPPAATATSEPVKVTITYWAFGSEGSAMADGTLWTDWYAKIFKQYQESHPGVTIDFALKG
jgi:ABC-type glycerol-3-phosphate transport system substrate-binding protein